MNSIHLTILLSILALAVILIYEKISGKVDQSIRVRYTSAILMGVIAITSIYFGKFVFATFIFLASIICVSEFLRVIGVYEDKAYRFTCFFSLLLITLAASLEPMPHSHSALTSNWKFIEQITGHGQFHPFFAVIGPVIILNLMVPIVIHTYQGMVKKELGTIFASLYFGWFLAHMILIRNMENGYQLTIFLLLLVIANDTFAFAVGKLIGKHKLISKISPKKTWEGFFGGLIGSILVAVLYKYQLADYSLLEALLAAVLVSFTAPFGDLTVSVIKRDMKQKDMGNLIPGHGGLLDRMDSIIFSAPNFFYFVLLVDTLKGLN